MIRVAIVDDHDLVREGIRAILEQDPVFQVVGETGDGQEAVRLANRLRPDVMLMDVHLPGGIGEASGGRTIGQMPDLLIAGALFRWDERPIPAGSGPSPDPPGPVRCSTPSAGNRRGRASALSFPPLTGGKAARRGDWSPGLDPGAAHPLTASRRRAGLLSDFGNAAQGPLGADPIGVALVPTVPPAVAGCIAVHGEPLQGKKVKFAQPLETAQTTTTDASGCYQFDTAVSGKKGKVSITLRGTRPRSITACSSCSASSRDPPSRHGFTDPRRRGPSGGGGSSGRSPAAC